MPEEVVRVTDLCVDFGKDRAPKLISFEAPPTLALRPDVMLFDELTSALDPQSTQEVLQVMRQLVQSGMTMLIVTHETEFAKSASDSIVILRDGRVAKRGTPESVFDRTRIGHGR